MTYETCLAYSLYIWLIMIFFIFLNAYNYLNILYSLCTSFVRISNSIPHQNISTKNVSATKYCYQSDCRAKRPILKHCDIVVNWLKMLPYIFSKILSRFVYFHPSSMFIYIWYIHFVY